MTDKHTPLKPCPFCGSAPSSGVHETMAEKRFYIECPNHDECPIGPCIGGGNSEAERQKYIALWNNRPIEADLLAACKAAAEQIKTLFYGTFRPTCKTEAECIEMWDTFMKQDPDMQRLKASIAKAEGGGDARS